MAGDASSGHCDVKGSRYLESLAYVSAASHASFRVTVSFRRCHDSPRGGCKRQDMPTPQYSSAAMSLSVCMLDSKAQPLTDVHA